MGVRGEGEETTDNHLHKRYTLIWRRREAKVLAKKVPWQPSHHCWRTQLYATRYLGTFCFNKISTLIWRLSLLDSAASAGEFSPSLACAPSCMCRSNSCPRKSPSATERTSRSLRIRTASPLARGHRESCRDPSRIFVSRCRLSHNKYHYLPGRQNTSPHQIVPPHVHAPICPPSS